MIALVLHILPDASPFNAWLDKSIARLISYYTLPPADMFDNLFGEQDEELVLGEYVLREVLDIRTVFDKQQTAALINHSLAQVDKNNPLLLPLNESQKMLPHPWGT